MTITFVEWFLHEKDYFFRPIANIFLHCIDYLRTFRSICYLTEQTPRKFLLWNGNEKLLITNINSICRFLVPVLSWLSWIWNLNSKFLINFYDFGEEQVSKSALKITANAVRTNSCFSYPKLNRTHKKDFIYCFSFLKDERKRRKSLIFLGEWMKLEENHPLSPQIRIEWQVLC